MNRIQQLLRYITAGVLLGAVVGVSAAGTAEGKPPPVLVFGVIAPSASEEQTRKAWEPLVAKIQKKLGRAVRVYASQDYKRIADGVIAGDIHIAWLSNAAALPVVASGQASIFAQMLVKGPDGMPVRGYESVVVTLKESQLRDGADLLRNAARLAFRMGPEKSTSGFLVPNYYLFAKRGISPSQAFRSLTSASHEQNLQAVLNGEADAAVNNSEELAKLAMRDPAAARRLKVIWRSPMIAQSPLLMRKDLPHTERNRIAETVLEFGKAVPAERSQLELMNNIVGFSRSSNRQLMPVADIEMFEARTAVMRRTDLSAEARINLEREMIVKASRLDMLLHDD
jgi:phosphonate transport system substrate-binding protein